MSGDEPLAAKRMQKELLNLEQSGELDEQGISVETINGNYQNLKGIIIGPADTPYENGKFHFYVEVPRAYPFSPLKIRFATKIWHPNVSPATGEIYLKFLNDEWKPVMGLKTALISIKGILSDAQPNNIPRNLLTFDSFVIMQFQNDQDMFKRTARFWAIVFAGAPGSNPEFEEKTKEFESIGEAKAILALSIYNWDTLETIGKIELLEMLPSFTNFQ